MLSEVKLMKAVFRVHLDNGFVTQYFNYGKHKGNTFSYNDSEKTLSVSYYSKLLHQDTFNSTGIYLSLCYLSQSDLFIYYLKCKFICNLQKVI